MARYQASCPCVCAQAWCGDIQFAIGRAPTMQPASCVATHRPMRAARISGKAVVPRSLPFRSVMLTSRRRISRTGKRRSRLYSRAFRLRSKWQSKIKGGRIGEINATEHPFCSCPLTGRFSPLHPFLQAIQRTARALAAALQHTQV